MEEGQEERLRGDFLPIERRQELGEGVERLGGHGETSSDSLNSAKRSCSVSQGAEK